MSYWMLEYSPHLRVLADISIESREVLLGVELATGNVCRFHLGRVAFQTSSTKDGIIVNVSTSTILYNVKQILAKQCQLPRRRVRPEAKDIEGLRKTLDTQQNFEKAKCCSRIDSNLIYPQCWHQLARTILIRSCSWSLRMSHGGEYRCHLPSCLTLPLLCTVEHLQRVKAITVESFRVDPAMSGWSRDRIGGPWVTVDHSLR